MHRVLSALIIVALSFSAAAVDIDLFLVNGTQPCDNLGFLTCFDVPGLSCCNLGGVDVFSARCDGLGLQDFCITGTPLNGSINNCVDFCDVGLGASTICVDPRPNCLAGKGAFWAAGTSGQDASAALQTKCEKSVEPDRAVFANGQSFRINYDVPADVSSLLIDLVRADPHLSRGVPEAATPYEIKAEKAA